MRELVVQINPSCIVDLSVMDSNYYKPNSILQISSAIIDNSYKNYKNITINQINNYVEIDKSVTNKTKYMIQDTITITNQDTKSTISDDENSKPRILTGSESIYISLLLSSEFNIPNTTLGIIEEKDTDDLRSTSIATSDKIFHSFVALF
jgi:hypothetical protein